MKNAVSWVEIPVSNFERAQAFYEEVLQAKLHAMALGDDGGRWGFLPFEMEGGVGAAIVEAEGYDPSHKGCLVYLNGGDDLNNPLGRVEAAGGKIILPKTDIGENGFFAMFTDSEGNRMAFHSEG